MPGYTIEEVQRTVARRIPNDDTPNLALMFEVETHDVHFEIIVAFEFWPQFRTFVAYPMIMESEGCGVIVRAEMPDEWFRYLKHNLRKKIGVRHFHNVNLRDNSKRIEKFLGLKYVH